jgi:hypothetical protein
MKNTIRNTVSEVYNTDLKNMKVSPAIVSTPSPNMFKVGNVANNTTHVNNNAGGRGSDMNFDTVASQSSTSSMISLVVLMLLFVVLLGVIYYFRDNIKNYLRKLFHSQKTISKEVVEIKENDEELKETKTVVEEKDKMIEKDKLSIKKDGELIVKDKIIKETKKEEAPKNSSKNVSGNYSPNQIVKQDDMYCYVGKDDNMRQCIEVFKDDVCTSGDIFNRIDECLVPPKQ